MSKKAEQQMKIVIDEAQDSMPDKTPSTTSAL
jgi:hypothetical protein